MYSPDRYVAALRFAATAHAAQKVPGTELPYLVHVTSVAAEVIAALAPGLDADLAVLCALLHDTIEDTQTTRADVAARFGERVADGVVALSKDATVPKPDRMADSLRRIAAQPREIAMVKLADRITNLAPPPAHWPRDKRIAYRDEAIVIADALARTDTALDARIRAHIVAYAAHFEPSATLLP
jgi:(p)ppGpp synthase/HD superfamily hydrolase